MQSRPADQFHSASLQVKIAGQNCLDVSLVGVLLHWLAQLNNAAELIAVTIMRIGEDELRVVLNGHVQRLALARLRICEPQHNFPTRARNWSKFAPGGKIMLENPAIRRRIPGLSGPRANICGPTLCKMRASLPAPGNARP